MTTPFCFPTNTIIQIPVGQFQSSLTDASYLYRITYLGRIASTLETNTFTPSFIWSELLSAAIDTSHAIIALYGEVEEEVAYLSARAGLRQVYMPLPYLLVLSASRLQKVSSPQTCPSDTELRTPAVGRTFSTPCIFHKSSIRRTSSRKRPYRKCIGPHNTFASHANRQWRQARSCRKTTVIGQPSFDWTTTKLTGTP